MIKESSNDNGGKTFCCNFFTDGAQSHFIKYKNYLRGCSCLDSNALCKHIFLVARITGLSYTFKNDSTMSVGGGIQSKVIGGMNNFMLTL
jgi:hypothetical protein